MRQNSAASPIPLTKDQFSKIVNEALVGNGEVAKSATEISELHGFYTKLWADDGGHLEVEMINYQGKMQLVLG